MVDTDRQIEGRGQRGKVKHVEVDTTLEVFRRSFVNLGAAKIDIRFRLLNLI